MRAKAVRSRLWEKSRWTRLVDGELQKVEDEQKEVVCGDKYLNREKDFTEELSVQTDLSGHVVGISDVEALVTAWTEKMKDLPTKQDLAELVASLDREHGFVVEKLKVEHAKLMGQLQQRVNSLAALVQYPLVRVREVHPRLGGRRGQIGRWDAAHSKFQFMADVKCVVHMVRAELLEPVDLVPFLQEHDEIEDDSGMGSADEYKDDF